MTLFGSISSFNVSKSTVNSNLNNFYSSYIQSSNKIQCNTGCDNSETIPHLVNGVLISTSSIANGVIGAAGGIVNGLIGGGGCY